MAAPQDPRRLAAWIIAMSLGGIVLLGALYLARGVLLLIYISALLAIGFSPIVRLIEKQRLLPVGTRRVPRWGAILALYLLFLGVLFGIGLMIVPPLADQAQALWTELPNMFARAQDFLVQRGILDHRLTLKEAVERAPGAGGDAVGTVAAAVFGFVGGLVGLITILILTFYLLVEADSIRDGFLRLFPARNRARIAKASGEVTIKVSAWLNGQLLLAGIIGTTAAIGLGLMGVPYFYVLALIAGVGEMIPVVGPLLSSLPALAVAATISMKMVLFVAIFFILQQQFENHVLVPKVMERQVGMSAVTVIIALLIGADLLGIVGAILAVPTAAILQVIFQEIYPRED